MAYCFHCNNTGWVDCHCGGDLCVCDNGGEMECPRCEMVGNDEDELEDDLDIDKCLSCGRYYSMTPGLKAAWHNSPDYREGAVMEQKCLRCMKGEPPPHEY